MNRYKWWRDDLSLWEERKLLFRFIPYYVYSIWVKGITIKKYRLFKKSNPIYIKKAIKTSVYVGKKEFKNVYNNNKWIVPLNLVLDLTRD